MKTEQTTIVYAQWDTWTSYDGIKHHMVTTDVTGKEESALLRIGLSRAISRLSRFLMVQVLIKYFIILFHMN